MAPSLTSGQAAFIQRLSQKTGLNQALVAGWVYNEENGSAAQWYQGRGDNDWLNIGRTDSGNYGSRDSVWSDPITAADATAAWMQGKYSLPGFGTASAGIQNFANGAMSGKQSLATQISNLQTSGWASGRYPSLPSIVSMFTGQPIQGTPSTETSTSQGAVSPSTSSGTQTSTAYLTSAQMPSQSVPAPNLAQRIVAPEKMQAAADTGSLLSQKLLQAAGTLLNGGNVDTQGLFAAAAAAQKARAGLPKTPPLGGTALARGAGLS